MSRHNATKEMTSTFIANDFNKIIKKLLTILDFPVVIALIYRNYKTLLCTIHVCHQFDF